MAGIAHSHSPSTRRGAARPVPWLARRRTLGWLNVVGGIAVLGSYAHGILRAARVAGVIPGVTTRVRTCARIAGWRPARRHG